MVLNLPEGHDCKYSARLAEYLSAETKIFAVKEYKKSPPGTPGSPKKENLIRPQYDLPDLRGRQDLLDNQDRRKIS